MLSTVSSLRKATFGQSLLLKGLLVVFLLIWGWTLVGTADLNNWLLENALVIIFLGVLAFTHRKFQFSELSYVLMFIYLCGHIYGAKYTYAENPFGYWLQDQFELERNHYDRIVHFSFGFLLAYPMRDFFRNWFAWPIWVCWVLPTEITLSFSGMYELVEWSVADIFFPEQGMAYLGTQGDIWDAQKDMGLAFLGSIITMVFASSMRGLFRPSVPTSDS